MIYIASEKDIKTWREYYQQLERRAIYHSPDYISVIQKYFGGQGELFIYGDDNNFVYYPYIKKKIIDLPFVKTLESKLVDYYDIVSSWYYGGPLLKSDNYKEILFSSFLDAFNHYAKECGIVTEFVRLDSNLRNHELYGEGQTQFNRETVFVDLTQTAEVIWADLSNSCKRAIKKASRSGFEIRENDSGDSVSWIKFHQIYESEMQRKDAPEYLNFPLSFFLDLQDRLKDNVVLLTVEKDCKDCGGFIIVYEGEFAFHLLSAALPEYWPARVNDLLFYRAIMWAKQKGCSTFDFMGGRQGVFRFKSKFSSSRRKFFTYQVVHDKEMYHELAACHRRYWGLDDKTELAYFPAYRYDFSDGRPK